jgi:hypothetical protein
VVESIITVSGKRRDQPHTIPNAIPLHGRQPLVDTRRRLVHLERKGLTAIAP